MAASIIGSFYAEYRTNTWLGVTTLCVTVSAVGFMRSFFSNLYRLLNYDLGVFDRRHYALSHSSQFNPVYDTTVMLKF